MCSGCGEIIPVVAIVEGLLLCEGCLRLFLAEEGKPYVVTGVDLPPRRGAKPSASV